MEAIIKATEPFITQDRSCDFAANDPHYARIKDAYNTAKAEIQFTKEQNQ